MLPISLSLLPKLDWLYLITHFCQVAPDCGICSPRPWEPLLIKTRSKNQNKTKLQLKQTSTNKHSIKLFYFGARKINIVHSRMRMTCSALKADLFDMHIIDDPSCGCGAIREDSAHYFFNCPSYNHLRNKLHESILKHASFNLKTLMYGNDTLTLAQNFNIFEAVHTFIKHSKRFKV